VTNVRPEGFGPIPVDSDLVDEYKDTFVKVKDWGGFDEFDIDRNELLAVESHLRVPDFVAEFERELDSEPGLAPDVCCFLDYTFDADWSLQAYDLFKSFKSLSQVEFLRAYFGPFNTVEDRASEEFIESDCDRRVGANEAAHLRYLCCDVWEPLYNVGGKGLKERAMDVMFFGMFAAYPGGTTTVQTYALARLPLVTI